MMKKTLARISLLGVFFLLAISVSCYCYEGVETSEVGLTQPDGVTVGSCVGAGRYSDSGPFSGLQQIDVSAKTLEWEDPDLVTSDKQPIGVKLAITYARNRDCESVKGMWSLYRAEAIDDEVLSDQVATRIAPVAKEGTVGFSLDEMLGTVVVIGGETLEEIGRGAITQKMYNRLKPQLEEIYVTLLDIRIANISVDPGYLAKLKEKAQADIEREIAEKRVAQKQAQLLEEKAETEVQLEKARRQKMVAQEQAKVYETSPQVFELERLKAWQGIIGENDKLIIIPAGTDLTMLLNSEGFVPLQKEDQKEESK